MAKREAYINAMKNNINEELMWASNFDYWLKYNTKTDVGDIDALYM